MKTLVGLIRKPVESGEFVEYLVNMAGDMGLNVHLLYVENPAHYPLGPAETTGVAMARLQESLEKMVKEGKKDLSDRVSMIKEGPAMKGRITVSAEVGNEIFIIQNLVDKGEAHMLAIVFKEMDGFLMKDSFARDMIRHIHCPIWVVPESSTYHSLRKIIYATDYNEEDIPTLKNLISLIRNVSPKIIALHVTDSIDFELKVKNAGFQKMLQAETEYNNLAVKVLVERGSDNIIKLINSYAAINHADLIVVLKENKNFLERIFNPSSSEKIVQDSDKPVLVYHY